MDRFVSHFTNRLDAKGRLSIPAAYRAVLARDGFDGLYAHPSLHQTAIDCGGAALLREIEGLIALFPAHSVERDSVSTVFLGESEFLRLDPEGRVVLTETLKARAAIAGAATLVGQGHKFQIWEPERFRAHLEEARRRARDVQLGLGGPRPALLGRPPR